VPYQDFGHNHWHNSLLWGVGIEDVGLIGPGLIDGQGLLKIDGPREEVPGAGNKAIALKDCKNVLLRDLKILNGGHFGVLASGVDGLTMENLLIDTNRDGIDIDSCRNVHVSNCTVNSPWDDAIVLKSSYSLGELRACEQVTITGCTVSGCYVPGSVLDGTFLPFTTGFEHDPPSYVGRIKIGTETSGDVRNVVVSNCIFEGCRGLTIVCEDGGHIEDVAVSNITMRDSFGAPVFLRLGNRLRGPAGTRMGTIRRVSFDGIDSWNARAKTCAVIAGLPGFPIEDITLRNLRLHHAPGGKLRTGEIPENGGGYPDLELFGATPAQGFYIRHAAGVDLSDVIVSSDGPDPRPVLVLDDVQNSTFRSVRLSESYPLNSDPLAVGRNLKEVKLIAMDGSHLEIGTYAP
jgi:polygalacturonase